MTVLDSLHQRQSPSSSTVDATYCYEELLINSATNRKHELFELLCCYTVPHNSFKSCTEWIRVSDFISQRRKGAL